MSKVAHKIPHLIEALSDKDPQVRSATAQTLGQIGEAAKSAVPALKGSLNDGNEFVRAKAEEALKKIEPEGGVD